MKTMLRLEPGEVHIWCAPLPQDLTALKRLESFLAPNELIRADRLRDQRLRQRFVAGRGFLRETVAHYLEIEPNHIYLAANEHGKPYLPYIPESYSRLPRFNLSHAGDLVLLAISGCCELGVDLEAMHDALPFLDMTKLVFSTREQEQLANLPSHLQREAFYRCWTRKEAYLKGRGLGFTKPANSFTVSLLPDDPPEITQDLYDCADNCARWRLLDLSVPNGYCAALAIEGDAPVLRYLS